MSASLLAQVKKAATARASEGAQLRAIAAVLGSQGWVGRPTVSHSRYGATGSTVRVYHYKGTPAGDFVLVTGPSMTPEVRSMAELAKEKAPAGFYVQIGAGGEKAEARVSKILKESVKEAKEAAKEAPPARKPRASKPKAPAAPSYKWGAGKGGAAPYRVGVERVYGTMPPKEPSYRWSAGKGGKAPYRAGRETIYGKMPAPAAAPSDDMDAVLQKAMAQLMKQLGL